MKIFVATPVYNSFVAMHYAGSLVRDTMLAFTQGYQVAPPFFMNETNVHVARNACINEFMRSDADQMLFIDSDLGWEPGATDKIMQTPGDIAGGLYRTKQDEIFYPFHAGGPLSAPYCRVQDVPTGFMRISRRAAELVLGHHVRPFQYEVEGDVEYGEDMTFCRRAQRLGLQVWARLDMAFIHVGAKCWSGRASEDLFSGEEG